MEWSNELVRGIQKGLLQWYDFDENSKVLYAGHREEANAEMLMEKKVQMFCVSCVTICDKKWQQEHLQEFDYIVCVETLEKQQEPMKVLKSLCKVCSPNGRMWLGMNNRLGIRYFCGDRDIYTNRNFDGIEGYWRAYSKKDDIFQGRCYSKAELKDMLTESGWKHFHFYSVLSDLRNPALIYEENYLPNEDLVTRVFPTYNNPHTVFLEEEKLYEDLLKNGMFHEMANAFLIECSINGTLSDISHVTGSMERGREDALYTIIYKSGCVVKRAICPEAEERLEKLMQHNQDLSERGISVVDASLEKGSYVMPYMDNEIGQVYLKRLFGDNIEMFLQKMDCFRDLILQSSEIVKEDIGDGEGVLLRKAYLDMIPLNSFYDNGTFVFFDQEFCRENYPANVIIYRMVTSFYAGSDLDKILPRTILYERYGLTKQLERWSQMAWEFIYELRKEKELYSYHMACRRNSEEVHSNRQRMNYSADEYQRLFVDIFHHADTRKLILFGSGNFTRKFLKLYQTDYPVYAIVDNDQDKWGKEFEGFIIQSPNLFHQLDKGEYKVLICIKNYLSVMGQLDSMGVTEYSIYDSHKEYPRKRNPIIDTPNIGKENNMPKKYHIGYISGVFDLFHVGHLNMFKRAKELCDYLIVGVVTDEGVRKVKKVETFVPFEERIEIVRSCRYVDETVEIPLDYDNTRDAFRLHHFDCQFSGSDYEEDSFWISNKEFLEQNGSTMVFFPYTESTSSSKIKSLIEKRLL